MVFEAPIEVPCSRTALVWSAAHADVAQLVEHHLAKVRVAGSNPVVRSERNPLLSRGFRRFDLRFRDLGALMAVPSPPAPYKGVLRRAAPNCARNCANLREPRRTMTTPGQRL